MLLPEAASHLVRSEGPIWVMMRSADGRDDPDRCRQVSAVETTRREQPRCTSLRRLALAIRDGAWDSFVHGQSEPSDRPLRSLMPFSSAYAAADTSIIGRTID